MPALIIGAFALGKQKHFLWHFKKSLPSHRVSKFQLISPNHGFGPRPKILDSDANW